MKKYIFKTAIIALSILTIASCKKKDDKGSDEEEPNGTPVFALTTLAEGDTIQANAMMHISGTITNSTEMHGYQILIHNHATMTDVFTKELEEHGASYNFDEHWTNNVSDTSNMMLTITAVLDHEGNTGVKVINFVCLP